MLSPCYAETSFPSRFSTTLKSVAVQRPHVNNFKCSHKKRHARFGLGCKVISGASYDPAMCGLSFKAGDGAFTKRNNAVHQERRWRGALDEYASANVADK